MKAATVPPARLLSDIEVATYLGASKSYVRLLIDRGVLKRVELPTADGSPGRARLLRIDVRDLDLWIDSLARE
jgi:helix-turn-helix protein